MQHVAFNPFAAVEQPAQPADRLRDLDTGQLLHSLGCAHLVGHGADTANARGDVRRFLRPPPAQESLEHQQRPQRRAVIDVAGLVLKHWAASFWLAIGVVFVTSLVAGVAGGIIAIRARGVYFALISFGLAQVVSKIVFNTRELGASDGIIGIPELQIGFGPFTLDAAHAPSMFLLTLAYIGVLFAVTAWLMDTPLGRLLSAVKANEQRVPFLGFDPWRVKLGGFTYSAMLAALSGALYPVLRGFVSPELLFFQVSVNAVINVIVGGTGTLIGPLYGAALLTGLRSVVGSFTAHHLIVIGLVFMASVVFFPRGLIGYAAPALQRWLDRRREAR